MARAGWKILRAGLIALAFIATPAAAQERENALPSEGRGFLLAGATNLDLDTFNAQLADRGYPQMSRTLFGIGAGGHAIRGRWVLGGEGVGLVGRTKFKVISDVSHEVSLRGGTGLFDLGYLIVNQNGLHVYPVVGVGGGGLELRMTPQSSPSFDEVLANPGRSARVVTTVFVIQVGVGIDKLFVLRKQPTARRPFEDGLVIGVQAGYAFTPYQSDWMFEGNQIAGGPALGVRGPYVRVVIGGGVRRLASPAK